MTPLGHAPPRGYNRLARVLDFRSCRSRTDSANSVGGRRCSRLRTGSKSSACPSTPSVSSKIALTSASFPNLTDQDLEKLGVLLGDRRKLLRAIRDLGNASTDVTASLAPAPTEPARKDDAER